MPAFDRPHESPSHPQSNPAQMAHTPQRLSSGRSIDPVCHGPLSPHIIRATRQAGQDTTIDYRQCRGLETRRGRAWPTERLFRHPFEAAEQCLAPLRRVWDGNTTLGYPGGGASRSSRRRISRYALPLGTREAEPTTRRAGSRRGGVQSRVPNWRSTAAVVARSATMAPYQHTVAKRPKGGTSSPATTAGTLKAV